MSVKKITVDGILPPTKFISTISNKIYIVPQWIEVDENFDFKKDLIWNKTVFNKSKELAKVPASRGNTIYTISELDGRIMCSCSGYKFKRDCKHVQKYKLESLIANNQN